MQAKRLWLFAGMLACALVLASSPLWGPPALERLGWISENASPTIGADVFTRAPTPPPVDVGLVGPVSAPVEGPEINPNELTKQIGALAVEGIGIPGWVVVDATTAKPVAGAAAEKLLMPASTLKLATGVAALNVLDHNSRFATRVLSPKPGTIVLVGGGDPYLSALPTDDYPRRASLQDLAAQAAKKLKAQGVASVVLGFDDSLFVGPDWEPSWEPVFAEDVTRVSALIADMGVDPKTKLRTATPALDAANKFAAALSAAGVRVTPGFVRTTGSGEELAKVESLPLRLIVQQFMMTSDNTATEVVLRHLAKAKGQPASFVGGAAVLTAQLKELGVWQSGSVVFDGSGVSRKSRLSPLTLAQTARLVAQNPKFRVLADGMPVAGVTGTLRNRFTEPGAVLGRGVVRAKTGSLRDASALVGLARTKDGRTVAIAFVTNAVTNGWNAKVWVDAAAATVAGCGCR